MTINLADNSPRISYAVAESVTQTSFAVPFEFFDDGDLNVYVDGTLKTIITDYTVTGGDGSTGDVSISVTGASGGSTVVITRDIDIERTTDFPTSGPFQINALNTELDRLTAIAADLSDLANRAITPLDYDPTVSYTLPTVDQRKGKTLAFNELTGSVQAGPSIADTQSVADISADIALLADIEDGTIATNAITDAASIKTDISTVAGIASNVTTVAGNTSNVNTVASISANVSTVSGISSNVTTVAGIASDVSAVSTNNSNVTTVATNINAVNTVASNIANVTTVANDLLEVVSEIETVANDLNEATSEIEVVANNIANVNTVGTISGNVTTVAGVSTDVTAVAGISGDVTSVASITADVSSVASIGSANIATVAGISSDVTAVAGISADVSTVADNLTEITSFAAIYRTGTAEPSTSLDTGDLFYNTSTGTLKIYNGSAWEAGVTAGSGFLAQSSNLSDLQDAATARTNLGVAIGVDVQAYDATLLNDADIGVTVQGYDATLLNDADIGVNVQAYDAQLTDVAGLTPTIAHAIVGNGTNFISTGSSTDAMQMPAGTDAERPSSPANGMIRYSTTSGSFEGYQAGAWSAIGGGGDVGAPTLSGSSSGNEFSDTTVTITDYDPTLIYRVSVTGGSYTRTGGTITWTLPPVTTDTIHYMTVNAIDNGVTSPDADWDIDVLNVAFTGDTGIQITNFASNTSNTGWAV